MTYEQKPGQVVYTNKAHCRDCYRCLRVCPVKAIRMENGQAYVEPERCISCGTCIRECPQGAKQFRNDIEKATRLIATGGPVAVSLAPSFAAVFKESEQRRIPSALRHLGFAHVAETAIGAYQVAAETAHIVASAPDSTHICTACPAVVSYVERYDRRRLELLVPLVSPMIAHARHIRDRYAPREIAVVFIGPCVAKKAEAERAEYAGLVDCVLTFSELVEWMERERLNLSTLEESSFDDTPEGFGRFFPLEGGSIKTSGLHADLLACDVLSASGFDEVREVLDDISSSPSVIEPLFCPLGCVNGPAVPDRRNIYQRRSDVLRYASSSMPGESSGLPSFPALHTSFSVVEISNEKAVTEEQIREVMEKTGKGNPENQLNCGACGYASCRDKAVAVIQGMAELEMCIPYMKRLAERRTDRIIETSPNGIVILDERLNIISMNPAFRSFFKCSEAIVGRPISYLMDPDPFEQVAAGKTELVNIIVKHERYSLVCHEVVYALPEERQYVGILVNITNDETQKEKLAHLRAQTLIQARELLEHQIQMAQTIARYVGESTARGEDLLERLMQMAGDEHRNDGQGATGMPWDTDTLI